ncbi:unnamed protein product [Mytilus coruscus]|uniref:B box-type domain-containing protein n=1 Tax=Mytilus coruscus TaxID=42192 RepID=A0A6J8BXB3_MYTCO|nr:unnamed protein product [Mytilus coruscus]
MAASDSVRRSQSIKQCEVCESNAKIKVKCIDCDRFMCETCKRNHSKYKDAEIHKLIDIKDINADDEDKNERGKFRAVRCSSHIDQICCMYCSSCNKLVCPTCIQDNHQNHDLKTIDSGCKDRLNKILKVHDEVSTETILYLRKLDILEKVDHFQYEEILRQIELDKKEAMEKVEQKYNDEKNKKDKIYKLQGNIDQEKKHFNNIAVSKDTTKFVEKAEEFENKHLKEVTDTIHSNRYKSKTLRYTPGIVFGMEPNTTTNEIDVTFQQAFNTDFTIKDLKIDKSKTIWTSTIDSINQVEAKNGVENLTITKRTPNSADTGEIRQIEVTNTNDLVFITSTGIYSLNKKDETIKKIVGLTEKYKPRSIHIYKNHIFIGMSFDDVKNSTDKAIIEVFTFEGKKLPAKTIFNTGNQFLINGSVTGCATFNDESETFTRKENSNKGTICYIDYNCKDDSHCGRLIKLNLNRDIQWDYRGNTIINSEKNPFNPCAMVVTGQDNVVVADCKQSSLHIIQPNGLLLTIVDLTLVGLQGPELLTLDGDGHLWIKSCTETKNGKLSELTFSGF